MATSHVGLRPASNSSELIFNTDSRHGPLPPSAVQSSLEERALSEFENWRRRRYWRWTTDWCCSHPFRSSLLFVLKCLQGGKAFREACAPDKRWVRMIKYGRTVFVFTLRLWTGRWGRAVFRLEPTQTEASFRAATHQVHYLIDFSGSETSASLPEPTHSWMGGQRQANEEILVIHCGFK